MSEERRTSSRLPYGAAMFLMLFMVLAAWVSRDRFRPVIAGETAPGFIARDLQGEPVTMESFDGKVVLLNIWATWCAPCRAEMPSMERLYREVDDEDFEIVAISVDAAPGETDVAGRPGASKQALKEFAEELDLTFPILHEPTGTVERDYQTTGVPESFLIGRDGIIYRRLSGATVWDHPRYYELIRGLLVE